MIAYLQRRREFACAHRYHRPERDAAWNVAAFGPYTEIHGHNYTVEVLLRGEVDAVTGIVVNLTDVKAWLRDAVAPFENGFVDAATPVMRGLQPSTENLARLLWERLCRHAEGTPATLHAVRVAESAAVRSEYRGENAMVYITRAYDFSAAHRLHAPELSEERNDAIFGKCNWPGGHGHNYGIEVTVRGEVDPETGFAYPLDRLDDIVQEHVLDPMDHRFLNADVPEFQALNPTSENLAVVIWRRIRPSVGEALYRVRVEETARNAFEYLGE